MTLRTRECRSILRDKKLKLPVLNQAVSQLLKQNQRQRLIKSTIKTS